VATLTGAERDGGSYVDLVRLSEQVIRTRNLLALDRQTLGLELPEAMVRHIVIDEQILGEEDDTLWFVDRSDRPPEPHRQPGRRGGDAVAVSGLSQSLRKRALIQEATGVLMQRFGLGGSQALSS
jgi:hypothetical protein